MDFIRRIFGLLGGQERPSSTLGGKSFWASAPDVADLPIDTDAQKIVRQICEEALAAKDGWQAKLSDSSRWIALKDEDLTLQVAVMLAAIYRRPRGSVTYAGHSCG